MQSKLRKNYGGECILLPYQGLMSLSQSVLREKIFYVDQDSHLVLGFHVLKLIFQFSEGWSCVWVILSAFHRDLIPGIVQMIC